MIELCSPSNDLELGLIKGILDAEGIEYFVQNESFGSMFGGPLVDMYNKRTILVEEEQHERAKELLRDFLDTTEESN
jgi:hypothetical protein